MFTRSAAMMTWVISSSEVQVMSTSSRSLIPCENHCENDFKHYILIKYIAENR